MSYREMVRKLRDAVDQVTACLGYHGTISARDDRVSALMDALAEADALLAQKEPEPVAWLRAIDEAMVVHHVGIAEMSDDYETAKRKLNTLLAVVQDIGEYFATPPDLQARVEELEREKKEILASLIDANGVCRSAWQIANRIATEFSSHELQTAFGPFADHAHESLQRQRTVINAHNRFATAQESGKGDNKSRSI